MVQLIELLENRNAVRILMFFLRKPTMQTYQQNIRKEVKLAKATLIKWLKYLEKINMLNVLKYGRTKVYSLNRENILIKHLKIMDNLALISEIKKILNMHNLEAYLYGSAARGEDTEDSDIDLLIIGKIKKEEIIQEISRVSESIKRPIKFEIFSNMEWSRMAKKDRAFYERVEKDKISL